MIEWIKNLFKKEILPEERTVDNFGEHPNDFEHRCCFQHQIQNIGKRITGVYGEIIEVTMQSGNTAIYKLFHERFSYSGEDTGQKNWKFLFIKYKQNENE